MPYKKHRQYRLPGYDYSQNGNYFITIVTQDRGKYFGEINGKELTLSPIGRFIDNNFRALRTKTLKVKVEEYAIMPDHLHLILSIDHRETAAGQIDGIHPLLKDSVPSFVNHLKGFIKRWCNGNGFPDFKWQMKYHDRIIRNDAEYDRIVWYMRNNVINWKDDIP